MGSVIQLFIISLSLAADALSVSVAGGIASKKVIIRDAVKVAAFFGLFQAGMPLVGLALGEIVKELIAASAHWVAFGLLSVIGIKMIHESLTSKDTQEKKDILDTKTLIILSIATSIDALIVGITLGLLELTLFLSISMIGVVTFVLCFYGYLFGQKIGSIFGKRIEIIGGIALILIGVKILIEHFIGS